MTHTFTNRSYTKKELALLYSPSAADPHSAVNRLMAWINRCAPLCQQLARHGYRKTDKRFTPQQVNLIAQYLGEP